MIEAVIGLIGVAVGAVLTGAKDLWTASRSRRKDGEYLGIRVVSILDRFIEGCTDVAGDDGLCHGQLNADGCRQIQISPPKFEIQSLDVDWKSISANLMYEILNLPNSIDAANHRIGGAFKYAAAPPDYEEGFEERQYQYAVLGLKASSLADELRDTYGIPAREYVEWNPIEYLKEQRDIIKNIRSKRNERHAQLMSTLQPEINGS